MTEQRWRKSSHSTNPSGCAEVAGALPTTVAAWRVLSRAVLDAIDIPEPATSADGREHLRVLHARTVYAAGALRAVLGNHKISGTGLLAAADAMREALASVLPTTYEHVKETDTAARVASRTAGLPLDM